MEPTPELEWERHTQSAFATVEQDARQGLTDGDPGTALVRLITFAGRLPFDRAVRSLTPWERAIVEGALGRADVTITPVIRPDRGGAVIIAQGALGKASLYRPAEPFADGDRPIAALAVPGPLLERANDIADEHERLEAVARASL